MRFAVLDSLETPDPGCARLDAPGKNRGLLMSRWTRAGSRVRRPRGRRGRAQSDSLDGLYRHGGCATHWDAGGVTLTRNGRTSRLTWEDILGVRRFEGSPEYVQLMVRGHIPARRLSEDHFSIPVNSDSDANRLIIALGWHARGRDLSIEGRV